MTKTLSVPQVTTAERDALVSPANGTLIYNTDLGVNQSYNGATWVDVGGGSVDLQQAYDAGNVVDMTAGRNLIFNKSTGGLGFEFVEAGDLSALKSHRAVIAEYGGLGGPFFYANTTSTGAVGNEIGAFYIECLDNTNTQKTFKNWATSIIDDNPATFQTTTVINSKINNAEVDCFSFGVENVCFRQLNMQSNPIANAGTITASQVSTPNIDLQAGSLTNSNFIETQSFTSAGVSQLNQIEQTNPFGGGPLIYNIFDSAPPAGSVSYQKTHFANNDATNPFEFMRDEVVTFDITAGQETAQRKFYCANSGTTDEYLRFVGNANQISAFKTLDMQGNSIVACQSIANNNGSINFSLFPELRLYTFGTAELLLESAVGNIKINNKIIYIPSGQALTSVSADTTYVFLGDHEFTSTLTINQPGVVIKGTGRENTKIFGSFAGPLINVVEQDFEMADITLTAEGNDTFALQGENLTTGQPNEGRLKTVNITNCQLRNCVNGISLLGFDLVDISQTLFYYFQARTDAAAQTGIQLKGTSKVEFSSCEFLRWFDESTIAAPADFFTGDMLEFVNAPTVGFGAVNINGCVVHPQQNQNGIVIDNSATFGFANLTSCTFVDGNLNTPTYLPLVIDIDLQPSWIIEANQGVPNYVAFINAEVDANATVTTISAVSTPTAIQATTFTDNGLSRVTLNSSTGVITKDSKRSNYFTINCTGQFTIQAGGNNQDIVVGLFRNGTPEGPTTKIEADSAVPAVFSFNVVGFADQNDTFQLYVQNNTAANDILVNNLQLAGVEA
jgi:hypothetical protein